MSLKNDHLDLNDGQLDAYHRDGVITLALTPELDRLRRQVLSEMAVWLHAMGGCRVAEETLGRTLVALAGTDRRLVGRLYKISRRFPAVKQLANHPALIELAGRLMETPLVSCCHFVNLRIDLPGEDRFLTPVHQDFPYIQGSLQGVTVWLPLIDTPLLMGPPSWIPGSHHWGLLPVREYALANVGGSGGKSFQIDDLEGRITDAAFVSASVTAGTALVFSTLLVHRSENNDGDHARINLQLRYDDALAPESFERNYPEGLFLGDRFAASYPDYVK